MEKYWTEDQLQPEGLPESLAKLIPEQELALSAWVADWLASPQSWSVYWTKPDFYARSLRPREKGSGCLLVSQSNGTNSIYDCRGGLLTTSQAPMAMSPSTASAAMTGCAETAAVT